MARLIAIVAMLLIMPGVGLAAEAKTALRIVDRAIEAYVKPGYAAFSASANALDASVATLCAGSTVKSQNVVRRRFSETVDAWSRIEFVRFGPVREQSRMERILFFPDRRGSMLRQVQALIAAKDRAALEGDTFKGKSVAVQGLPALEFVLFGSDEMIRDPEGYRCALARAITVNLAETAMDIDQAWRTPGGITQTLRSPGPDNDRYRSADEALAEILKVLSDGYELIAETRLAPFVGDTMGDAKPKRALFWRSRLTRDSLLANLDGLNALAEKSGMLDALPSEIRTQILRSFPFENRNANKVLLAFDQPLFEAVLTENGHGQLGYIEIVVRSLRQISIEGIMAGYELASGFSSLDGD